MTPPRSSKARPARLETEVSIVTKRVGELASNLQLKTEIPNQDAIMKIVTIFRELYLNFLHPEILIMGISSQACHKAINPKARP